jgi:hypothetical protein
VRDAHRAHWPGALPVAAVFAAAVLFRAATAEIVNDDFLHLAVAQQIVLGDIPVRDFIDPGEFLFNYTSAAAQLVLGRTVGAEVVLDIAGLALGHTLVFLLAARASGSRLAALFVTALSAVLVTRLYSYPKLFLYPAALLIMWRYADRRSPGVLYAGALCTAVAFLFRHDHGANIAVATAVTVVLAHWRDGRMLRDRLARFAAATGVLLLPFLAFLQLNGAGLSYWRNMLETGRAEYQRTVGPYPRFSWELTAADNALAWFYYLTVALPPITLLVLAAAAGRTRAGRPAPAFTMSNEPVKMAAAATLAILMHLFLLRAASESAVADVSALTAVLAGWLLGRLAAGRARAASSPPAAASNGVPRRRLAAAAGAAVIAAASVGFATYTEGAATMRDVAAEWTDGEPGPVFRRFAEYWRMRAPFEDEGARYVHACTEQTDRLLVASAYAPHAYYAAGRGFAAGRQYFLSSQGPSREFREFSARRLEQERVPIVLVNPPDYPLF